MAKYQKCPVCDGQGLVVRPPYVAGDQETWVASETGPFKCGTCGGEGIIVEPQAEPVFGGIDG